MYEIALRIEEKIPGFIKQGQSKTEKFVVGGNVWDPRALEVVCQYPTSQDLSLPLLFPLLLENVIMATS